MIDYWYFDMHLLLRKKILVRLCTSVNNNSTRPVGAGSRSCLNVNLSCFKQCHSINWFYHGGQQQTITTSHPATLQVQTGTTEEKPHKCSCVHAKRCFFLQKVRNCRLGYPSPGKGSCCTKGPSHRRTRDKEFLLNYLMVEERKYRKQVVKCL